MTQTPAVTLALELGQCFRIRRGLIGVRGERSRSTSTQRREIGRAETRSFAPARRASVRFGEARRSSTSREHERERAQIRRPGAAPSRARSRRARHHHVGGSRIGTAPLDRGERGRAIFHGLDFEAERPSRNDASFNCIGSSSATTKRRFAPNFSADGKLLGGGPRRVAPARDGRRSVFGMIVVEATVDTRLSSSFDDEAGRPRDIRNFGCRRCRAALDELETHRHPGTPSDLAAPRGDARWPSPAAASRPSPSASITLVTVADERVAHHSRVDELSSTTMISL